jgi:hypothetical protein
MMPNSRAGHVRVGLRGAMEWKRRCMLEGDFCSPPS